MYREKRKKVEQAAGVKAGGKDSFGKNHPAVWEFLTADEGKDGVKLQTASFTVFLDGGMLKCCCTDKQMDQVCFWTANSWEELWAIVEGDLAVGGGDWRADRKRRSR